MNHEKAVWHLLCQKDHEDHKAEKGFNSLTHFNLVHKFVLVPQAMKNPDANAAVVKEWEKPEKLPAWHLDNVKCKKVHFAAMMDIYLSSQTCGV